MKLWGIIGVLPAFWRFVQCFRRWADSRQWFPHLPNAAKYSLVLMNSVALNLWRTDKDNGVYQATFVGVAFVSSTVGCSTPFPSILNSANGLSVLGCRHGLESYEPLRPTPVPAR